MNKRKHVFLSYRSVEVDFALKLAADLKNAGVNLWMDRLDIKPGDDWLKALQQAVNDCAAMIPVLSPDYVASKYCQRELARADRMARPIFPVMLQPVPESDWPFEIERQQHIDFSRWRDEKYYQEQLPKLVDILKATVADQITVVPDVETRYINTLIAELEARKGVIGYFESSPPFDNQSQDDVVRPRPIFAETWNLHGRYLLTQNPSAEGEAVKLPAVLNNINEALEKYPRFVLVGASGTGKTITLNHLVLEAAHRYLAAPRVAPLPLLLRLHQWNDDISLVEFVHANWPLDSDPLKLLAKGKVCLYVDGLNEVDQSSGSKKIDLLRDWLKAKNAPQRAVFTCRLGDFEMGASLGIPMIQTVDLDASHIQRFVEHYLEDDEARYLLSRIMPVAGQDDRSSRYLFRMARNPFLLSALILIFKNSRDHEILYSMGGVIKRLVVSLWERKQHLAKNVSFETLEAVLADLAFAMVDAELPIYIPLNDAMEYLGGQQSLLKAAINTYLLEVEGNKIRFSHELIKEYFAAVGLMRAGLPTKLMRPHLDETMHRVPHKWDSAMGILAGIASDPDSIVLNILEVDPYLALQCAISGVECSDQTYQIVVNRLLDMMQVEGDGRVAVARILAGADDEKALLILLEAMRDGAWPVRAAAAVALQEMSIPLMPGLIEAIENLDDSTRDSTLTALRQMSKKSIPTLLRLLHNKNFHTRRGAAWALGELKDAAAVPLLLETLHDPDYLVGADAALALGRIKDPVAIPGLLLALGHENWRVSKAASKALAWIGAPAAPGLIDVLSQKTNPPRKLVRTIDALAYIKHEDVAPALLKATYSRNVEVRSAAIEALRDQRDNASVKRLIECLADTARSRWSKQRICDMAASILITIGSDEALAAVKKWRKSEVRPPSGSSLRGTSKQAKDRLTRFVNDQPLASTNATEAINDPDWVVRRDAVLALAGAVSAHAVPRLLAAANDEDSQVRMSAISTLANFKDDPQVIPTLILALGDEDYLVCDAAKEALKRDGKPPVPGLMEALHHTNVNIRGAAIEILGAIGDADAIPDLIDALADIRRPWLYDDRICDIAIRALEAIGTPETKEVVFQWRATHPVVVTETDSTVVVGERDLLGELLQQLREGDWNVQQEAAKSLREMAKLLRGATDSPFVGRLQEALADPLWVVRWAAAEALAWIRDRSTVTAIIPLLGDANKTVRAAALRALSEIRDVAAVNDVARTLTDKSSMVREAAAEALGNIGDPGGVPALVMALGDGDKFVRIAAIYALGKINDTSAGDSLVKMLRDPDSMVRCFAADALGHMAYPGAVSNLILLLHDTDGPYWEEKRVCDVAADALHTIGTPEAARAVSEWRSTQPIKS